MQLHHPLQITQKQIVTQKEIQQQDKQVSVSRSFETRKPEKKLSAKQWLDQSAKVIFLDVV